MKKVLFALLTIFALSACSNGGFGNSPSTLAQTEQKNSEFSEVQETYQFIVNGCDTGKQVLVAHDAEAVSILLCKALQNHALNQSCAEARRHEYFIEKKCPGVWTIGALGEDQDATFDSSLEAEEKIEKSE